MKRERTRAPFESWRDEALTQIAAACVLACVFVRYTEGNDLVADVRIAGHGRRRQEVIDAHEAFFREHPRWSDREYLLDVFETASRLSSRACILPMRMSF